MEGYYTGRVSNIDTEKGYVRVAYPEYNNSLSSWLSMLATEYDMPKVGDLVATLIDRNGKGVVLGKIYSNKQKPPANSGYCKMIGGTKITASNSDFRIDFDSGYISYSNGTLHISSANVVIDNYEGRCTHT